MDLNGMFDEHGIEPPHKYPIEVDGGDRVQASETEEGRFGNPFRAWKFAGIYPVFISDPG